MAPEARRQQILDSALELVLRDGYAAATMQLIAREAGVTRPVVYEFFADRDELLVALLGREATKATAIPGGIALDLAAGIDDPLQMIVRAQTMFLDLVVMAPQAWRLMLMGGAGAPQSVRDLVAGVRMMIAAQIRANIEMLPAVAAGEGLDAELIALVAMATSEAAAREVLNRPAVFTPERFHTATAEILDRVEISWQAT